MYNYIKVPINLFYMMDANCTKVLVTLLQMSEYYADDKGWFYRTINHLEDATGLSQNVLRATLDALFQEGLVEIVCVGTGKGKHPNMYRVCVEKFQEYEKMSLDEIISGGVGKIETIKYKNSHYSPSYMRQQSGQQTGQRMWQKVSTNINNIDNITNIDNIENTDNITNIENTSKENIKEDNIILLPEVANTIEENSPGEREQKCFTEKDIETIKDTYSKINVDKVIQQMKKCSSDDQLYNREVLDFIEDDEKYDILTSCLDYWNADGAEKFLDITNSLSWLDRLDVLTYMKVARVRGEELVYA